MNAVQCNDSSRRSSSEILRKAEALRSELLASRQKAERLREAIQVREKNLSRLEALIALNGDGGPAISSDE